MSYSDYLSYSNYLKLTSNNEWKRDYEKWVEYKLISRKMDQYFRRLTKNRNTLTELRIRTGQVCEEMEVWKYGFCDFEVEEFNHDLDLYAEHFCDHYVFNKDW